MVALRVLGRECVSELLVGSVCLDCGSGVCAWTVGRECVSELWSGLCV